MKKKMLGSIAEIQIGYPARKGVKANLNGNYKLLQGKNVVSPSRIMLGSLMTFSPATNPDKYLIRSNDILFQSRGSYHFATHIPQIEDNVVASGSFYIIRTKTNLVLPSYLAWWLNYDKAKSYFEAMASSTLISFISIKTLSKLNVMLPTIETQKKIEKAMNLWQHEMRLRKKLIELRGQLVQATYSNMMN